MLFTKEHVHVKNSILEKQNVPLKSIEMNIAVLRKSSEVGDHLLVNPDHNITWQIIAKAPTQTFRWKILEVFYISKLKPTLNSQQDIKITYLFSYVNTQEWDFTYQLILCVDNVFYCNFFKWLYNLMMQMLLQKVCYFK